MKFNNKNKIRKWTWKKILSMSLSSIAISSIVSTSLSSCAASESYEFDGKTFGSQKEVENYARSQLTSETTQESTGNDYWLIKNNGVYEKYNDPYYLKQKVSNNIETIPVSSSLNMNGAIDNSTDAIGAVPNTIVGKLLGNNNANSKTQKVIYRGRNNKYYYSEKEAKQSYLNINNAYFFDGIYFPNKESLNVYLNSNYNESNSSFQFNGTKFKSLKSPNGFTSTALEYSDNSEINKNDKKLFSDVNNFVDKNYKNVYGIRDSEGIYEFANTDSWYDLSQKLTVENTDPFVMYSNQGTGSYIVDTDVEDEYNFYGPYFYRGSADILDITNKSLWKEVEPSDRDVLQENRKNNLIQGFFSILIEDNSVGDNLFGIPQLEKETKDYTNYMISNYPILWKDIIYTKKNLELGKRYNSFLKIPILYTYIIERLVINGADNIALSKTKKYFKSITELYDNVLRATMPKKIISPSDNSVDDSTLGDDGLLSFTKLFGFGVSGFDYNSDIDYYMDKIKIHYKNIFSAASLAVLANQNGSNMNGLIKFYRGVFSSQIEGYRKDLENEYQYIWDLFSCNTPDKLKEFYNSHSNEINFTLEEFCSLTRAFGLRNWFSYQSLSLNFEDQVKKYLKDKSTKSSLSLLKNIENLDLLLSKVGTCFELFTTYSVLPYFGGTNDINKNEERNLLNSFYKLYTLDPFNMIESRLKANLALVSGAALLYFTCFLTGLNIANQFLNNSVSEKIWSVMERGASILDGFNDLVNGSEKIADVMLICVDSGQKFLLSISRATDYFSKLTKFLSFFKVVSFAVEALQFLIDAFVPKYEPKSYIYKTDNVEYVWDGGLKGSMFFGLLEWSESSIDNMKILNPILLNEPRASDFYYLNGKYYNPITQQDSYLKAFAKAFDNGQVESDYIKLLYSFSNESYKPSDYIPEGLYENKSDLVNHVFEKTFIEMDTKYTDNQIVYKFANGNQVVGDRKDPKDVIISDIMDNIKITKIAMLPNLDQFNYPIKRDDDKNDGSINTYVLPGNSYDMKSGKIIPYEEKDKENKFRYVIIDPNQQTTQGNGSVDLEINSEQKLMDEFMNSFNVESKVVYENETIGNDYFSDFSYQPTNFNLYKAKNEIGDTKYFMSQQKAFSWLLKNYNFQKIQNFKEVTVYTYINYDSGTYKEFYSIDSFLKWVKENTKKVGV